MNTQVSDLHQIQTQSGLFDFLKKVLRTSYPVAIWRLPRQTEIRALIHLGSTHQAYTELESLHQCFLVNPYSNSHPVAPLILNGDLLFSVNESGQVTTRLAPEVSAEALDQFQAQLKATPLEQSTPAQVFVSSGNNFAELVHEAIQEIKNGDLQKVVLSRYQDLALPHDFDVLQAFEQLNQQYPNAFCHLTSTEFGVWLGATPEKLIAVDENRYFITDALAGTQPLAPDQSLTDIAWTQKEIEEQALVSRYIVNCFKKIRLREFDELGPKTVKAGNLAHLKTEFRVDMEATNSAGLASTMLELLHPTSAVCGSPLDLANDFISRREGYDRELYAGFLGPVGFGGSSRLFVNLRCMKVLPGQARLYAGAGITEDSDPQKELRETEYKMLTLRKALSL